MMPETTQDFAAKITYLDDWTAHLAAAGRTIATATVTASAGTISGTTPSPTGVRFRLDTTAVPIPAPRVANTSPALDVVAAVTVTLDNGDIDVRHHTIRVTNA